MGVAILHEPITTICPYVRHRFIKIWGRSRSLGLERKLLFYGFYPDETQRQNSLANSKCSGSDLSVSILGKKTLLPH